MALRSMTGYGFGEMQEGDYTYTCEIKSLNSRFLEANVRLPRSLIILENEIISKTKSLLARGKVDIFIDIHKESGSLDLPALNREAVKHYASMFDTLQDTLQEKLTASFASLKDPSAFDFFRLDGILNTKQHVKRDPKKKAEKHKKGIFTALEGAIEGLKGSRTAEGENLKSALKDLVATVGVEREIVLKKSDNIRSVMAETYTKKLENILNDLREVDSAAASEIPHDRLLTEIAVLADKSDIEEELTRLAVHEKEFMKLIDEDIPVGRKMDFLCQELHREVNTISNKLMQTDVSHHTLNMKQAVERLRQQIQNIE